jgi:serine/threonine-protein kinase RsbW
MSLQFSFPSDVNAISASVERTMEMIRASGCALASETDLEITLFEALANAVIHGNAQDASKQVHIVCECRPGKEILIIVRDEGCGFDLSRVPDPTAPENIEAEHGRGILLMRTFMDEVRYEAGGTELHLRKKLDGTRGSAASH